MSTTASAKPTVTSETPLVKSGVSSGIRVILALLVALSLGVFILLWDGQLLPHSMIPSWVGPYIFIPLMAVVLGFGSNCLIQQLSCGQVQWLNQLQRMTIVPIPFVIMNVILYMLPGMRWPIEGLIQSVSPQLRNGLSSAFYTFWTGMYCQGLLNGLAQICPK